MRKGCEKINRRLKEAIEKEGILVAAHRGTCGGNIIENTTDAYECAIKHRADIVEMDAVRSADGELFMFHDGNEKRLLGVDKNIKTMTSDEILSYDYLNQTWNRTAVKVNRLGDVFDYLKGRCLINLDRAENIFEYVIPEIEKRDMLDQIIIKSEPCDEVYDFLEKCKTPVMFMSKAMCADDIERTIERNINIVAYEIIYTTEDSDLLDPANKKRWHDKGVYLWTNALKLKDDWNRSANHEDNGAILRDMDANWGWLADQGFDIIQTDWPLLLKTYLESRKTK